MISSLYSCQIDRCCIIYGAYAWKSALKTFWSVNLIKKTTYFQNKMLLLITGSDKFMIQVFETIKHIAFINIK